MSEARDRAARVTVAANEHAAYQNGVASGQSVSKRRLWLAHRLGWSHGYKAALQRAVEIGLAEAIQEYDQVLAKVLDVAEEP